MNRDNNYNSVPQALIQRSRFDLSFGYKTTLDSGYLIPIMNVEVLPGDTFNVKLAAFLRLATPIKPVMDNMYVTTHFWFVPWRLVWDNSQKFFGAQANPGDSVDYLIPQVDPHTVQTGSLSDYFGLPIPALTTNPVVAVNSLPFRAYNLIWNEWYRDQNLQSSVPVPVGDGPDNISMFTLLRRGKRGDYFTTSLPAPQRGATSMRIPVSSLGANVVSANQGVAGPTFRNTSGSIFGKQLKSTTAVEPSPVASGGGTGTWSLNTQMLWDNTGLVVQTDALGTINQLRQAVQIQRLLEREARSGTRYTEWVRGVFDVISPDARLQRPEFLGGGRSPVNVSPIPQQAPTVSPNTPQGNLAGMGTASVGGHGFHKSFTEHGVVLCLLSVTADLSYQMVLERQWTRRTKYDTFIPQFAGLGEQAVLGQEIYYEGTPANDTSVFGYQERYAEYRSQLSKITGLFRSQATGTLDIWHLAQKFTTRPVLSSTFIQDTPPITRVIAVQTEPQFLLDSYFDFKAVRPLPVRSIPGQMDRL